MKTRNRLLAIKTLMTGAVLLTLTVIAACAAPAQVTPAPPTQAPAQPAATQAPAQPAATQPAATQAPASSAPVTIQYWFYPEFKDVAGMEDVSKEYGDWERYQAEQFMKENPNIKVETTLLPFSNEGYQKVLNAITAGAPPDLVRTALVRASQYNSLGVAEDISNDLSTEDRSDFDQAGLDQFTFDGKLVAYPHFAFSGLLVINQDLVDKAGAGNLLPTVAGRNWTHQQFLDVARAVQKLPGNYGVSFPSGGQTADFLNHAFIKSYGASLFSDDYTKVVLNSPEGVKGLQFMMDAVKEGLTPPGAASQDYYDAFTLFTQGKVGMIAGGNYTWQEVEAAVKDAGGTPFKLYGANFPSADGKESPVPVFPTGIFVFKQDDAARREAVMKYAAYLTNAKNQEIECKSANQFCFRKSLAKLSDGVPGLTDAADIVANNPVADTGWRSPYFGKIRPVFFPELQAALLGQKTAQQALDDFTQKANALIAEQ